MALLGECAVLLASPLRKTGAEEDLQRNYFYEFFQDVAGPLSLKIVTLLLKSQNTLVGDRDKKLIFFMDDGIGVFPELA